MGKTIASLYSTSNDKLITYLYLREITEPQMDLPSKVTYDIGFISSMIINSRLNLCICILDACHVTVLGGK